MHCDTCDRDSSNRRVCPYCFTPYPSPDESVEKSASKRTGTPPPATPRQAGTSGTNQASLAANARERFMQQTPLVRWSAVGIFLIFAFWVFSGGDEAVTTAGGGAGTAGGAAVAPAPALPPMTLDQARAHIAQTRGTALVETNADEVFVSFSAATFPLRDDGQRALVERFRQADEVVEGRKRRIFFYNPNGRLFAQTDGAGNVVIK